jgi:hypothetical protein
MIFDMAKAFDRNKAAEYLGKLTAKEKGQIELKQIRRTRSNRQNRFLHVVLMDMGEHLGYSLDEIKTLAKRHCGMVYDHPNGGKFLRSTAKLDTKEFCTFVEHLQRWAAESFDYYVPDPNENI